MVSEAPPLLYDLLSCSYTDGAAYTCAVRPVLGADGAGFSTPLIVDRN